MELVRVVDGDVLQLYSVHKPDNKWLKAFPKKNVCVMYDVNKSCVCIENIDTIPLYDLFDKLCYVFSTQPEKQLKTTYKFMNNRVVNKDGVVKKCGFNSSNPELITKEYNAVLSLMSLSQYEYSPRYLTQEVFVQTTYDELTSVHDFQQVFTKIVNKHCEQFKHKHVVDFVKSLQQHFPLNYGGSLRRFPGKITTKSLSSLSKDVEYYVGYDCRNITGAKEIKLAQHMEQYIYSNNDYVYVYETYNNSIDNIKQLCKNNGIVYKDINKHCVLVNNDDYNRLSSQLKATLSDFIC